MDLESSAFRDREQGARQSLAAIRVGFVIAFTFLLFSTSLFAAEGRYALVVGNSAYQHIEPLRNALGDSKAIEGELKRAGFQVKTLTDSSRLQLLEAVEELATRAEGGGEVVFFFAGHGIQIGNTNYLLPVDFRVSSAATARFAAVNLYDVSNRLQEAKVRFSLLIIDACRNNPLTNLSNSRAIAGEKGLAPMTPATGQMIVYSAGSGQLALDRLSDKDPEQTSVFVREFVKRVRTPGLAVRDVIDEVRDAVEKLADSVGHAQRPAVYDESKGRFFFFPQVAAQALSRAAPEANAVERRGKSDEQIEDELWTGIESRTDRADFELYLREYPKGRYAANARIQIDRLTRLAAANRPITTASTVAAPDVTKQFMQVGLLRLELPGTDWKIFPQATTEMSYFFPNTNTRNTSHKIPVSESVAVLFKGDRPAIALSLRTLESDRSPYVGGWSHDSCEYPRTLFFQADVRSFRNSVCRYIRVADAGAAPILRGQGIVNALGEKTPRVENMYELGYAAYLESGIVDVVSWVDPAAIGSLEDAKLWLAKVKDALQPVAQSRRQNAILPPVFKQ